MIPPATAARVFDFQLLAAAWKADTRRTDDLGRDSGSAVLFGFSNTFATIPGIVGVAATGWLVDVTGTYSAAFVLTAVVSTAGALIFGFLFDARPIVD